MDSQMSFEDSQLYGDIPTITYAEMLDGEFQDNFVNISNVVCKRSKSQKVQFSNGDDGVKRIYNMIPDGEPDSNFKVVHYGEESMLEVDQLYDLFYVKLESAENDEPMLKMQPFTRVENK